MYLGIDLGGTKIAAGLVDNDGHILGKRQLDTQRNRPINEIVGDILLLGRQLIGDEDPAGLKGVGIGVPGLVDPVKGMVINCVNLGWKNIPIERFLREGFGLPAFAGNDATLAGVAELEAGMLKGVRSGVLLTLGTGIGSAVICNGRIQYGAHNLASEIGHMIVGTNFYNCSCGRNGCLETFASATALVRYAKKLLQEGEISVLSTMTAGDGMGELDGSMIFAAAREGDPVASKSVDRAVHYLALGIMNVIAVIDPDRIVLGGGMSQAGDYLSDRVRNEVERLRFYKEIPIGKIINAKFGNDAGIIGAAMLARQRLREE